MLSFIDNPGRSTTPAIVDSTMAELSRLERKRQRTRDALLQAARDLATQPSGQSFSVQDITDRADVGLGTFYNYFNSKQHLYDAVLSIILDDFEASLEEYRSRLKDPAVLVTAVIKHCCKTARSSEEWFHFQELKGELNPQMLLPRPSSFQADLTLGVRNGRFRIGDAAITANLLLGMLQHVCRQIRSGAFDDGEIQESVRCVLRILGVPDPVAFALAQSPVPPARAISTPKPELINWAI